MDTPDNTTLKYCSGCEQWKPADRAHFNAGKSCKDGLTTPCKECAKARARDWYHANKERGKASRRAWAEANREENAAYKRDWKRANRQRLAESTKVWYQTNKESIRVRRRKWYLANADHAKAYAKEWDAANPERHKVTQSAAQHRRRARKLGNGGNHTNADLAAIRAAQTDNHGRLICWLCGKPIKGTPHIDHFIPLAKGGTNDPGNLHYTHGTCNQSKGAKLPSEIGRLL